MQFKKFLILGVTAAAALTANAQNFEQNYDNAPAVEQNVNVGESLKGFFGGLKEKVGTFIENQQTPGATLSDDIINGAVKAKEKVIGTRDNPSQFAQDVGNTTHSIGKGMIDTAVKTKDKVVAYSDNPNLAVQDATNTAHKINNSIVNSVTKAKDKVIGIAQNPEPTINTVNETVSNTVESAASIFSVQKWKDNLSKVDNFLKQKEAENNAQAQARKGNTPN